MKNKLYEIISKLDGYVFCVGADDQKVLDIIDNNKNVQKCLLFNIKKFIKSEEKTKEKNKKISVKKVKKLFKKEKANYIVCNISDIDSNLKTFIVDSLLISNKKIYYYGSYDYEFLEKIYKKFNVKTKLFKFDDEFILEIDNKTTQISIFKKMEIKLNIIFYNIITILENLLN